MHSSTEPAHLAECVADIRDVMAQDNATDPDPYVTDEGAGMYGVTRAEVLAAMRLAEPTPRLSADTVYLAGDRFVCASVRCAGYTALMTGITTGGVTLAPMTPADVADWALMGHGPLTCECGAVAATL